MGAGVVLICFNMRIEKNTALIARDVARMNAPKIRTSRLKMTKGKNSGDLRSLEFIVS